MVFDESQAQMRLEPGVALKDALAWGRYEDKIASTGWSELYVDLGESRQASNDAKMYAAGFIEGLLTCDRVSQYYANTHMLLVRDEAAHQSLPAIKEMIKNETAYLKAKANLQDSIAAAEPHEGYWKHSRYILFQLWGLADGYNLAAT